MLSSPVVDQLRKLKRQKEEDLLTSPEYAEQKGVLLKQSRLTYEIEQEVKRRQLLEGHEPAAVVVHHQSGTALAALPNNTPAPEEQSVPTPAMLSMGADTIGASDAGARATQQTPGPIAARALPTPMARGVPQIDRPATELLLWGDLPPLLQGRFALVDGSLAAVGDVRLDKDDDRLFVLLDGSDEERDLGSLMQLTHDMATALKKTYDGQANASYLAILLKKLAEDELGLSNANLCKLAVKKGGGTAPAGPLSEVRRGLLKPCKGINFLPVLSLACRYSLLCAARNTDEDGEFEFFDTDLGYEGATPLPQTAKHSSKKAK